VPSHPPARQAIHELRLLQEEGSAEVAQAMVSGRNGWVPCSGASDTSAQSALAECQARLEESNARLGTVNAELRVAQESLNAANSRVADLTSQVQNESAALAEVNGLGPGTFTHLSRSGTRSGTP
jgi:hypothetical protein